MRRLALVLAALALAGCAESSDSGELGSSDIVATGSIHYRPDTTYIHTVLSRNACERLGWLTFRDYENEAALVFDPGPAGFSVGSYTMQWEGDGRPTGWLNYEGLPSLLTVEGTTLITSVTDSEVRGSIIWTVAMPLDQQAPDTSWGTVEVRGTFRAVHVSGDDNC